MTDDWRRERTSVAASFDAVADLYREEFADELDRKPSDRALLDGVAARFPTAAGATPVLEVGAGPGQVGAYLARLGVPVVVSDVSAGQLREARVLDSRRPLVVADLARLPVGAGSLAGIVAFYCLIYGPAGHLDDVFADWRRALVPGGLVVVAVHAGAGTIHADDWRGRPVDLTVVLRDPDDLAERLERHGLAVTDRVVRPPYDDEHPTDRCTLVAARRP